MKLTDYEILRRLLVQFDAKEIERQLAEFPIYHHDDLVAGDEALPRLMRCIQLLDVDFGSRTLNEVVELALSL